MTSCQEGSEDFLQFSANQLENRTVLDDIIEACDNLRPDLTVSVRIAEETWQNVQLIFSLDRDDPNVPQEANAGYALSISTSTQFLASVVAERAMNCLLEPTRIEK